MHGKEHLEDESLRFPAGNGVRSAPPLEHLHQRFEATVERLVLFGAPFRMNRGVGELPRINVPVRNHEAVGDLIDRHDVHFGLPRLDTHRPLVDPLDLIAVAVVLQGAPDGCKDIVRAVENREVGDDDDVDVRALGFIGRGLRPDRRVAGVASG